MSADAADAAADADAAAERRLNHSIPRTYFVRGIQLITFVLRYMYIYIYTENSFNNATFFLFNIIIIYQYNLVAIKANKAMTLTA